MTNEHHHTGGCFRTFAENEHGYIGICAECRIVNVAFQNSLFCLTFEEFDGFCDMMRDRVAMRAFYTTHGKELLLMTPMPNYFLLFSDADLRSLGALLSEAAPVVEAERILSANRVN